MCVAVYGGCIKVVAHALLPVSFASLGHQCFPLQLPRALTTVTTAVAIVLGRVAGDGWLCLMCVFVEG